MSKKRKLILEAIDKNFNFVGDDKTKQRFAVEIEEAYNQKSGFTIDEFINIRVVKDRFNNNLINKIRTLIDEMNTEFNDKEKSYVIDFDYSLININGRISWKEDSRLSNLFNETLFDNIKMILLNKSDLRIISTTERKNSTKFGKNKIIWWDENIISPKELIERLKHDNLKTILDSLHKTKAGFKVQSLCNTIPKGARSRVKYGEENKNFKIEDAYKYAKEILYYHDEKNKSK